MFTFKGRWKKMICCEGSTVDLHSFLQGWEFAHALIAHLLISLKSNEGLWAICSDRSRQTSDHEQIAQVAERKLASLKTNERFAQVAQRKWANEQIAQKKFGENSKILCLVCFITIFCNKKNERIAHFLSFGKRCEWIAQVAHQKWVMWANRSGC